MAYTIRATKSAEKEIRKLHPEIRRRVRDAIRALAGEPRPDGVRKMSGYQNRYRIKAAKDYRVLYDIFDDHLVVTVVRVASRGQAYK